MAEDLEKRRARQRLRAEIVRNADKRLREAHKAEYFELYEEERAKQGLRNA